MASIYSLKDRLGRLAENLGCCWEPGYLTELHRLIVCALVQMLKVWYLHVLRGGHCGWDSGQSFPAGWGVSAIGLPCPLFNQPGEQALPSVFWLEALRISCQVSWKVTQWLNLGLAPTFSFLWIQALAGLEAVRNTIQRFIISVFSSSSVSKIKQRRKRS